MPILKSNGLIRAIHQPLGTFQFAMCTHVQPPNMKTRVFHFKFSPALGLLSDKILFRGQKNWLQNCAEFVFRAKKKTTKTTNKQTKNKQTVLWAQLAQIFRFGIFFFFNFSKILLNQPFLDQNLKILAENF